MAVITRVQTTLGERLEANQQQPGDEHERRPVLAGCRTSGRRFENDGDEKPGKAERAKQPSQTGFGAVLARSYQADQGPVRADHAPQ